MTVTRIFDVVIHRVLNIRKGCGRLLERLADAILIQHYVAFSYAGIRVARRNVE